MTKKPKRGRPTTPLNQQLTATLLIHCRPDDKAKWQALAEAAGVKLATWARDRLNRQRK